MNWASENPLYNRTPASRYWPYTKSADMRVTTLTWTKYHQAQSLTTNRFSIIFPTRNRATLWVESSRRSDVSTFLSIISHVKGNPALSLRFVHDSWLRKSIGGRWSWWRDAKTITSIAHQTELWLPVHCVKHGHLLVHVDTKLFREVGVLGRIQYRSGSIHHSVKRHRS